MYLHDIFVCSKNVTSYVTRNVNHMFLPRVIPSLLRGVFFTVGHIYAAEATCLSPFIIQLHNILLTKHVRILYNCVCLYLWRAPLKISVITEWTPC